MLTDLRDRFKVHLRDAVPGFREVKEHPGRLEDQEIKAQISGLTPSCRVGLWGRVPIEHMPDGQVLIRPGFAVAIIVKSTDLVRSHDEAMGLAVETINALAGFIPGEANEARSWDPLTGVGLIENLSLDISSNDMLDREGIALWGVLCAVPIRMGVSLATVEAEQTVDLTFPEGFDIEELQP